MYLQDKGLWHRLIILLFVRCADQINEHHLGVCDSGIHDCSNNHNTITQDLVMTGLAFESYF